VTIEEVRDKNNEQLMQLPNVIGTGIGVGTRGGSTTGHSVIRVYVSHKIHESQLQPGEVIPKEIEEYETDVIDIGGEIVAQR
jgi:hypothetical protein